MLLFWEYDKSLQILVYFRPRFVESTDIAVSGVKFPIK